MGYCVAVDDAVKHPPSHAKGMYVIVHASPQLAPVQPAQVPKLRLQLNSLT